ncbi:lysophospholipid acyltransferase family protein [Sphingomonas cavernae]|uniref:1-acyl-sn-glycerol-3-phosphate acyltransferase n=1 Tax=Sphingomonas cavernae TaxID=2320861 RepID=A0A418WRA4_9SPHN|nr:lysophospholipid acyltransferase family protein [Sphingomonas cavernae]RJF93751.1 1-acyl-sn-glycerol-3-phosphate acyltransferase [Sphingomonas cavernae]
MMTLLRSLLFALVFYPGSLFYVLSALAVSLIGAAPLRRVARGWAQFHRWCAASILGIRSRIEGIIPDYPVLYAMKHESMYETVETLVLFRDPAVLAKQELIDMPLWGRVAELHGAIPIDREGGASALRKLVRAARAAAAEGRSLVIFPEGTRVPHGTRPPLRSGFAGLYRQIGLPVVPVALDSGRVWPRASFLKRPGTITFRFGEVIQPGLDRNVVEALVHAEINRLND